MKNLILKVVFSMCVLTVSCLFLSFATTGTSQPDQQKEARKAEKQKKRGPVWGAKYDTPENQEFVRSALTSLTMGPEEAKKYFRDSLIVGPNLWARLKKAEPGLDNVGTKSICVQPGRGSSEMRMFNREQVAQFVDSEAFQKIGTVFSKGQIRAATTRERERFYYEIPFEIKSEPLTVSQVGKDVLLAFRSEDQIFWLEML